MARGAKSGVSFGDYLREKREEEDEKKGISTSSSKGDSAPLKNKSGKTFGEYVYEKNTANDVDSSYVKKWFTDASSTITSLQTYMKNNDGKYNTNYGSEYASKIGELLDSTDKVSAYLRYNKDSIEDYDNLFKSFGEMSNYLRSSNSRINKMKGYYSKFDSEGDYHGYIMTKTGDKTDGDSVKARQDAYSSITSRIAEIDKELDKRVNHKGYDALVAEKDRLQAYVRQYERGGKEKDTYFTENASKKDYEEKSANRDFGNSTKDEYDEFDTKAYGGKISYYDGRPSIKVEAMFPYTTSPEDAMEQMGVELSINDPLGFYFDTLGRYAEEDETSYYSPTERIAGAEHNSVLMQGDNAHWSNLTEDEIQMYYYLLNDQGKDSAMSFLGGLEAELGYRETEEYKEYLEDASLAEFVFANAISIPANIVGGTTAIVDDAISMLKGEDPNFYNSAHSMKNFAEVTRGTTAEELNEHIDGEFLGMTAGDAYQALMSGADSFVGANLFGPAYMGFMVTGAMSSGVKDLYESGASTEQIITGAAINGAAEYIGEKIPLDNFFKMKGSTASIGQLIGRAFLQGGYEMGGEMITELANIIGEAVNLRSESEWAKLLKENDGAFWDTVKEMATEKVWKAGAGGFISGMLVGGAQTSADYVVNQPAIKAEGSSIIAQGGVDNLKALALDVAGERSGISNFAAKVALKSQAGKVSATMKNTGRNAKKVGQLSNLVDSIRNEQNIADIEKSLMEKGLTKKQAEQAAQHIYNDTDVDSVKSRSLRKIMESDAVHDWYQESYADKSSPVNVRNRQHNLARAGLKETEDGKVVLSDHNQQNLKELEEKVLKPNYDARSESIEAAVAEDGKTKVVDTDVENGKSTEVTLQGIDHIETRKNENGKPVKYVYLKAVDTNGNESVVEWGDVEFANRNEAVLYESFVAMDIDPVYFDAFVKNFNEADFNTDIGEAAVQYATGFQHAFRYGWANLKNEMAEDVFASKLTESVRNIAYTLGKESIEAKTNTEQKVLDIAVEERKASGEGKVKPQGKLHMTDAIRNRSKAKFSRMQRAGIELAKRLTALGVDVHLYESTYVNGRWLADNGEVAANGFYRADDGSIHIDINAGDQGQGIMVYTLAHELTHFMRQNAPREFKIFADLLVKWYGEKGESVTGYINRRMAEENLSWDDAYEEFIARSCESFLTDSNIADRILELKNADKKTWEVIRDKVLKFLKWMRSLFADVETESAESQFVRQYKDEIDHLYDAFYNALASASETHQWVGAEKSTASSDSDVKQSTRKPLAKKGRTAYNEFASIAMQWAGSNTTKVGDAKIIYDGRRGKYVLIEASVDGYIENASGNYERVRSLYEQAHRGADNDIYENLDQARTRKGRGVWDLQPTEDGGYDVRDVESSGGEGLRTDAARDDEHLRWGNKGEHVKKSVRRDSKGRESNETDTAYMDAFNEYTIQTALWDALDHKDNGDDNLIRVSNMPSYVVEKFGIDGDFYIYRDHAYENMVSRERAVQDGRPVTRHGENVHFHELDVEKMTRAMMSINNPTMTISTKTTDGNPAVIMILDEFGFNNAPLYAVLSFYSNKPINGKLDRKPHIVLTVAERDYKGAKGRAGYDEIIKNAIKDGRVLDYNAKKRDDLSVIAESAGLGNITKSSLKTNLARFRKEVNSFREKNKISYSRRNGTSNRSLLANALESATQHESEAKRLAEYKANIDLINAEEQKLKEVRGQIKGLSFAKGSRDKAKIKSLQDMATRIENRVNVYDKRLLRLEATAPLRAVLEREKANVRKAEQQKTKAALANYREQSSETLREVMERNAESRRRGVESRHKTEMRHKIKKVVSELNQLLLHGTRDKHIKIGLQKATAEALSAINMDTVNAEKRLEEIQRKIDATNDPDKIAQLQKTYDRIELYGENMMNKLTALKNAYEEIKDSNDPLVANAHHPEIEERIKNLRKDVGDTPLREMSLEQLENVYDTYTMVLHTIRSANKKFKADKGESIETLANKTMAEVYTVGGIKAKSLVLAKLFKKFFWNGLKPVYAFKAIGSSTLSNMFDSIRAGEDTWAVDVSEAKEYYKDVSKKYNYDSWDFDKQYQFISKTGRGFSLSIEQIMSLYAFSKRKQADEHLDKGGFVFDEAIEVKKKTKLGVPLKYNVNVANAYNLSRETLGMIVSTLTDEQKAFVDEMQAYLSDVMGAKGNEVSLEMFGVKLFKEKFYFPLKSAKQYMYEQNEVAGEVRLKNSGFSKETKAHAKNPIILSNFMDVWSSHVNDMSMYHSFVLPLEDFNRVFNYNTPSTDKTDTESVKMYIQNAYGSQPIQYISQLLKDLNGGARTDSSADIITKGIGLFKKSAVFASASVVIQQPSAIARATALMDSKYFVTKLSLAQHKEEWAEVKKYAPVAIIKEMGYFDTHMGRSSTDFIKAKEYDGVAEKLKGLVTDSGYRDEVLSKAPAVADELAWCYIWNAVKKEIADTSDIEVGSEGFLKKCGERFTEIVVNTQVYDSVLSRSGMMRSKDTGIKMATAFMAEPTTSINMIADAIIQGKRGNKKGASKQIGAVIASMILNSILVSFVYAGRDDDEDKTYAEKYAGTLTAELIDSINPLTMIPFVKDIVSIAQGYDVERSDMAVVSDLFTAYKKLSNDNLSAYRKVEDFGGAIASIFGLPVKNILRDVRAAYNTISSFFNGLKTTGEGMRQAVKGAVTGEDKSKTDSLYEAIVSGDTGRSDVIKKGYKDNKAVESAIRKGLRENDPRIKAAAKARYEGDITEYMRIVREIKAEGHFSQDTIVASINAEINQLKPDKESTSSSPAVVTVSDYYNAIVNGQTSTAKSIKDELVAEKVAEGNTKAEAEKSVASSFVSQIKEYYLEGAIGKTKAVGLIESYGGEDMDGEKKTKEWDFEAATGYSWSQRDNAYRLGKVSKDRLISYFEDIEGKTYDESVNEVQVIEFRADYPEYSDVSSDAIKKFYNPIKGMDYSIEDTGMRIDVYSEYYLQAKDCDGVDSNNDGRADSGSKKAEIMQVIHSLPITAQQKDALYHLNGWSAKTLYEAPWH